MGSQGRNQKNPQGNPHEEKTGNQTRESKILTGSPFRLGNLKGKKVICSKRKKKRSKTPLMKPDGSNWMKPTNDGNSSWQMQNISQ